MNHSDAEGTAKENREGTGIRIGSFELSSLCSLWLVFFFLRGETCSMDWDRKISS
jgi:hypothetical protein